MLAVPISGVHSVVAVADPVGKETVEPALEKKTISQKNGYT